MTSTTVTLKYLKEAQYESKLFKVCEFNANNSVLSRFVKPYEDTNFIYLKTKYLDANKTQVEPLHYYKMKLYFDTFTNKEDKDVTYISKVRVKETDYTEPDEVVMGEDSDTEW